ncbi:hypothetical protein F5B20DRAFT_395468 [Whalleya microplaca]|nr:hypothetical protein F5B20DRAFT_395468 [Whalleya microplaca]
MAQTFVQAPNQVGGLLTSHAVPTLGPEQSDHVLVRWLAAPISRVDVLSLAGQYPAKPQHTLALALDDEEGEKRLPIPGFDGCGVVQASRSPLLAPGDLVLPQVLGLGTWRTHAVLPATNLAPLPPRIRAVDAALLRSGALVAWLLLELEEAPLRPGDYVMMSAGTSCVAQFLVQLARRRGLHAVLVVRGREPAPLAEVKEKLLGLGAMAVLTEEELVLEKGAQNPRQDLVGKVVLALDCVFGAVGQRMVEWLAPGGRFVLVGMLAGTDAGIEVRTEHLFYKQLSFVPFRSSEVLKRMGDEKTRQLMDKIAGLLTDGTLKAPEVHVVHWKQRGKGELEAALQQAVEMVQSGQVGYKKTVWLY